VRKCCAALVAASSAANAGSGGGGGGATLQLSCAKGCAVRGCNFTGNAAPGANGGGLLANVRTFVTLVCGGQRNKIGTFVAGREQSCPSEATVGQLETTACTHCSCRHNRSGPHHTCFSMISDEAVYLSSNCCAAVAQQPGGGGESLPGQQRRQLRRRPRGHRLGRCVRQQRGRLRQHVRRKPGTPDLRLSCSWDLLCAHRLLLPANHFTSGKLSWKLSRALAPV
jgi:hypothetical protein